MVDFKQKVYTKQGKSILVTYHFNIGNDYTLINKVDMFKKLMYELNSIVTIEINKGLKKEYKG